MREHLREVRPGDSERERARPREPAALPFDACAVLALQRTAGNAATARLLQRNITYDNKNSVYSYNSARAGWQVHADKSMLDEYNERFVQNLTKLPYDKLKLARAHIGSYDSLQSLIVEFLNGKRDGTSFSQVIDDFTALLDRSSDEWSKIDVARRMLLQSAKSGSSSVILPDANKLLSLLNNLTENLRAADKYLNSYIQERLDLFFIETAPGVFSLTEHGKKLLVMGVDVWGQIPRTPEHGKRVVTSEGAIPISGMSPKTKPVVESYPFVQVPIKSDNVKDRLYGPTALQHWAKAPSVTAQPVAPTQPVATAPAPRYEHLRLVHKYSDGTDVHEVYDTLTKSNTYVLADQALIVLKVIGPVWAPPPRYTSVWKQLNNDGTELHIAQDSQSGGGVTWLWVFNGQVIQDLGPGFAPMPQLQPF